MAASLIEGLLLPPGDKSAGQPICTPVGALRVTHRDVGHERRDVGHERRDEGMKTNHRISPKGMIRYNTHQRPGNEIPVTFLYKDTANESVMPAMKSVRRSRRV